MPADLLKAHQALDKAVDACYGIKKGFTSEVKRVAFLFELYEQFILFFVLHKIKYFPIFVSLFI
jgi:hypothetical protein